MNIFKTKQDGHHFADDIFKYMFMTENVCTLIEIEISLKIAPLVSLEYDTASVSIVASRRIGNKPLSEPRMAQFTIYTSLGNMNAHIICHVIHAYTQCNDDNEMIT